MGQTPKTDYAPIGEIVVFELHPGFCRETKTVTNSGADDIDLYPGHPMDDNVPVIAGNEANTDGLLMERAYILAGTSQKVPVLARGPAVLNKSAFLAEDYAGDDLDADDLETALVALDNIITREEPTLSLTQDT